MKVKTASVVTTCKVGKKEAAFRSGFVFKKKEKVNKKVLQKMAFKSAETRFKESFKDSIPTRVTQKFESISYFAKL